MSIKADLSLDVRHGFLPKQDPITTLPNACEQWEQTALALPKLLASDHIRETLGKLPEFPLAELTSYEHVERAMLILSYLGHAYVWCNPKNPAVSLPANLAQPWFAVSQQLGRPPVLSYESYALYNWRRLNPKRTIELGNIALLQNFFGGIDEEWFILIHVDIEAKAIPALQAIRPAIAAANDNNLSALDENLQIIASCLEHICNTLARMPEFCDPYIYYNRVRPYIHGWKDNPALPDGLIYEGVAEYHKRPRKFKGETGAQSGIIPAMDALLGVGHAESPLKTHLVEMLQYMPPKHRAFVLAIQAASTIRDCVQKNYQTHPELRNNYNECIQLIGRFRTTHLNYAGQYIQMQSQTSLANSTQVGTGGTPFMEYLAKHKRETESHLI